MGIVYLFTAWFSIPFHNFVSLALLSITTISGFASMGYLVNDFFDREKDFAAGKENFLLNKSRFVVGLLFLVSFIFLFFPWFQLPFNRISLWLILAEIILLLVYSLPPLRIKERGLAGVFTDALYAHSIPVILAGYTFSLAAQHSFSVLPVMFLFLWQLAMGVRNILLHQYNDRSLDSKVGNKTWVIQSNENTFRQQIEITILAEISLSLIFFLLLSFDLFLFFPVALVIFFLAVMASIRFKENGLRQMLLSQSRYFPNAVYEKWMPAVILFSLGFNNHYFWIILLLHTALFNFEAYIETFALLNIYGIRLYWRGKRIPLRSVLSFIVNHFIYYVFRIFGVNLKKENLSALEYINLKQKDK